MSLVTGASTSDTLSQKTLTLRPNAFALSHALPQNDFLGGVGSGVGGGLWLVRWCDWCWAVADKCFKISGESALFLSIDITFSLE